MILKVFSVFDVKADAFQTPFFAPTAGLAVRMFKDLTNDERSTVSRYPADFKLVQVGEFNDQNGALLATDHFSLGFATDYVERSASQLQLVPNNNPPGSGPVTGRRNQP